MSAALRRCSAGLAFLREPAPATVWRRGYLNFWGRSCPSSAADCSFATAYLSNSAALLSQQPIGLPVLLLHTGVSLLRHLLQALLVGFLLLGQLEVKLCSGLQEAARSLQGNAGHWPTFWPLLFKTALNAAVSSGR